MSESTATAAETAAESGGEGQEQTFTQADVDRIVKERVTRERAKFSDYDALKSQAEGAKTLEQQVADLRGELDSTKAESLRARVAAEHGISTKKGPNGEPSDADLFLTGSTEETLLAQASRLAAREADRKKQGNVAPKEGATSTTAGPEQEARDFVGDLFGGGD